ncbi:MAG: hypothetical protein MUF48_10995 [Pirellulaceae bacterium]|jgi:hypothetical protein|nr:hypothetical protein [Pirellulaceae bacterium]
MNAHILTCGFVAALAVWGSSDQSSAEESSELDRLVGQPVDIAPWAYAWHADVAVQDKAEAYFIPRRLARIDKVYRTAFAALPQPELKSIYYDMPDLLSPLPASPKGRLLAGLLWTGGVAQYQVQLEWPSSLKEIPPREAVEVRVYPTAYGWFGWTVDKVLSNPVVSADGRTWTYQSEPGAKMDWAYNVRVDAATEMVAVFCDETRVPDAFTRGVPRIRVVGPSLGCWQRIDLEIEWGFQAGAEQSFFDGRLEPHVAIVRSISPLPGDRNTSVAGPHRWTSWGAESARRGVVVSALYAPESCPGLDSRLTVMAHSGSFPVGWAWSNPASFTIRLRDLENGPILMPNHGVFVAKVGSGTTARQFVDELAAKGLKSVRQMTREHREAASWEEVMCEVRLGTCPPGTAIPPLPHVADPPMPVQLPDAGWTAAWRAAAQQLRGKHMWGGLAFEVGRVAHAMDLVGLHEEADKVYEHFLASPGVKPDGDYTDGAGALEWATSMRHDMGYSHDGTHASTGRLLFAMAERFFLTGDREWFERHRVRLQAAADWIIRQRTHYVADMPHRHDLHVAGLMPPCMLGDYAIPSCDWHWYYVDNALSLQGVQRFADALAEFDADAGRRYREEAAAFREDIRRAVEREAVLAPVRLGRDGMYHSYIPRMAYARGLTGPELGAPQFPDCDRFMGALPLAEPFAVLDASDPRMVDTLNVMEELGTSASALEEQEAARRQAGLDVGDAWFWHCYVSLPKASHNANIYLLQDDVPNFLRFWMNSYAAMVGSDGRLWEHWHLGSFTECTAPDNGTAGWFMENFRNMLVMEAGESLWLARATPRAWLEQGKRIRASNAPTHFGTVAYELVSDVDHRQIHATVELPSRKPPKEILLRLRHPTGAPIKSVTINGRDSPDFDAARELARLRDVSGHVTVTANY